MRKVYYIAILLILPLFFLSCDRKKEVEDLNVINAPGEYGKVMSRALKKTKSLDNLMILKNKINTFQIQEGRYPSSLNELVEKKYIEKLPQPPEGMKYYYDSSNGKIDVK